MALGLTHNVGYRTVIARAQAYLEHSQFDEESGITPSNAAYGGIGYGSHPDRPDLSNLQMALESLKDSGVPGSAPVWKRAIVFLQRVQNRKESNDQDWAKEGTDDGGFLYAPTGKTYSTEGPHASYGSMTYAGLKSYIYCGVSRDDPRAVAAWNWIRSHYTVTEHPGMGDTSLYYYYHTMAKTLDVFGRKMVVDTHGASHDWSHDLALQIASAQHPDGSWFNSNPRYWEDQPALVTSYSLITLSYCLRHA
jgi:squalene-hopene/tetraprenyl-beta-curcumene cyclase